MHAHVADDEPLRRYDLKLLTRFLKYLKPYKLLTGIVFIFMFVKITTDLIGPYLLKISVDGPIAQKDYKGLFLYAGLFLGSIVLLCIFDILGFYLRALLGQKVIMDLRTQLFSHLLRLPCSFYDRNPTGKLLARLTSDLENMVELFSSGLAALAFDLLLLVGILTFMFVLNFKLTLVMLSIAPFAVGGVFIFRKIARDVWREVRKKVARLSAYLNENISGMKIIQLFNAQRKSLENFDNLGKDLRKAGFTAAKLYSIFWPSVELASSITFALLLWYGGLNILKGTLSFGAFLAFWYCLQKFMIPVVDFAEKLNILQAGMAASERVFKLLDLQPEPILSRSLGRGIEGDIEFRNVYFSYDGEDVLKGISFKLKAGESIAIIGLTGAGKTTLVNLLMRMYEIKSGNIFLDGKDIREWELSELRRNIAFIPQDVFLFSATVRENLTLAQQEASDEKLQKILEIVGLKLSLDQDIKERGVLLSQGQKQLLSIARALLLDRPLLVLDEATSAVDSETESFIQQSIKSLLKGRTSIIIAHRLSTIKAVDRILVLHKGKLVEEGTHEELIKRSSFYKRLHELYFATEGFLYAT